MDEPVRDQGAGHVGDQQPAPLRRRVLENHQADRQGPQPRPDRQGGARHARRARGRVLTAARAADLVQVVLHSLRHRGGDFLLLEGPGNPQVSGVRQVAPACAGTLGEVVLGSVRDLPGHRRARAARLLPLLLLPGGPLRGPPLPPRRPPPPPVIGAGRHRGVPAVPRQRPQRRVQPFPQVSDHRFQHGDLLRLNGDLDELPVLHREPLRLLADQRVTRILRQRRIGHSRQSSSRPQAAATPAPGPPPKRNRQSPGATQKARACMRAFRRGKLCRCLIRPGRRLTRSSTPPWP